MTVLSVRINPKYVLRKKLELIRAIEKWENSPTRERELEVFRVANQLSGIGLDYLEDGKTLHEIKLQVQKEIGNDSH